MAKLSKRKGAMFIYGSLYQSLLSLAEKNKFKHQTFSIFTIQILDSYISITEDTLHTIKEYYPVS